MPTIYDENELNLFFIKYRDMLSTKGLLEYIIYSCMTECKNMTR